jgi:uncharacterized repeat protein (TIGR02543 family)/LPXTG-motif cell wall-anchored protein
MTKLFKALGATLLSVGLVVAGMGSPANAAVLTATATAQGTTPTTGTNPYPITVSTSVIGSAVVILDVRLPSNWSFVTPGGGSSTCPSWLTSSGINSVVNCTTGDILSIPTARLVSGSTLAPGTTLSITFAANSLNLGTGRVFSVALKDISLNSIDTGTATIASSGPASATVTFDANGGSGSMSAQTSSSAITLTPNAFSRTNYNFAGWNTAADGTGTAYADAASYPFTASETLYAQWTPILANTGIDAKPYLYGGLALAIAGSALLLIARRKQTN